MCIVIFIEIAFEVLNYLPVGVFDLGRGQVSNKGVAQAGNSYFL